VLGNPLRGNLETYHLSSNSSGCPASGVYTGIGQGMHGEIVVQVICERNRITKIDILQHHETPMISDSACSEIPFEIIRDQKVDVDAVSGATYTSNGIKEAVRNALQKAVSK
jgi:urocanate reductase